MAILQNTLHDHSVLQMTDSGLGVTSREDLPGPGREQGRVRTPDSLPQPLDNRRLPPQFFLALHNVTHVASDALERNPEAPVSRHPPPAPPPDSCSRGNKYHRGGGHSPQPSGCGRPSCPCVLTSPSHKDAHQNGLGPTLVTSCDLRHLFKDLCPNTVTLRHWGQDVHV